jgi:hypothetical protein
VRAALSARRSCDERNLPFQTAASCQHRKPLSSL